jgi:uncharacterized OB-fold protein
MHDSVLAHSPYAVIVASFDRLGVRLVSNLVDAHEQPIEIGQAITLVWQKQGEATLPRFRRKA